MPKEIWGEGRVCGMSSYEIYVKQHLAVDPNTPPASEREWLASSIASGSSLLLKIPANISTGDRFIDIQLPHNSNLAAANTIVASFFDGEAHFPGDDDPDTDSDSDTDSEPYPWDKYWADRITDYGQLISNNSSQSPDGIVTEIDDTSKLPTQAITAWSERKQKQLIQYMNIIDGIVIQPGNWITATNQPPEKDFIPNLANTHPRVRLHMRGSTSESPLVLLTGFTMNSVLNGITGDEGSTNTNHPENGDFLGPEDFPWVSKIVFSVPNSFINYMVLHSYTRELKDIMAYVDDIPIIDMEATNPVDFYNDYTNPATSINLSKYYSDDSMSSIGDPRHKYWVAEASKGVNTAVLTVYQKDQIFPPALYGNYVVSAGHDNYLSPLDIVAPGSVKMFYNSASTATAYENEFPGTHAFNLTSSGKLQYFYNNNAVTLVSSGDDKLQIQYLTNYNEGSTESSGTFLIPNPNGSSTNIELSGTDRPKLLKTITSDGKSAYSLMMSTNVASATGYPSRISVSRYHTSNIFNVSHNNTGDNLTWSALLYSLKNNYSIDLLGDRLKETKYSLVKEEYWNPSNQKSAIDYTHANVYDSSKGLSYIPFGNDSDPKRLYILSGPDIMDTVNNSMGSNGDDFSGGPDPTNIPVGSIAIGLGWHSIYRLITQSNGVKSWTPSYGAEFDCGSIPGDDGSVDPGNYVRRSFLYGLIIVGRGEVGDGRSISDSDVGKYYNTEISTYSASSSNHLFVAFVDNWSRVHILSESDDSNIQVTLRYKVTKNEVSGAFAKIPTLIRIQNNSYGPTRYRMQWMLIGQLTHRSV